MHSKNISVAAREHMGRVKELPCSVCDAAGPSQAHHIEQGQHFTTVALCEECHTGPTMGWHGQRRAWKIRKLDELGALDITLRRLLA
jgi:hypothetical protein